MSYCLVDINWLVKLWEIDIKEWNNNNDNNNNNNNNDDNNNNNNSNSKIIIIIETIYIFAGDRKEKRFFSTDQIKKIRAEPGCEISYWPAGKLFWF